MKFKVKNNTKISTKTIIIALKNLDKRQYQSLSSGLQILLATEPTTI
tara:strand:+ start:473 stop:613 length:141 start_codon:yes stop_codon:yes gene_type:complete